MADKTLQEKHDELRFQLNEILSLPRHRLIALSTGENPMGGGDPAYVIIIDGSQPIKMSHGSSVIFLPEDLG